MDLNREIRKYAGSLIIQPCHQAVQEWIGNVKGSHRAAILKPELAFLNI